MTCDACGQSMIVVSKVVRPVVDSFEPGPWVIANIRCGCLSQTLTQRHATAKDVGQPSFSFEVNP